MNASSRSTRPGRGAPLARIAALLLAVQALVPPVSGRAQTAPPASSQAAGGDRPAATAPAPSEARKGRKVLGRIRGTVFDAARKPLAGLMVMLSANAESGSLRVTGTDERGDYLFQDLPAGLYNVDVSADGYVQERKGKIDVRPPFQNLVDFQLTPLPAGGAAARAGERPASAAPGSAAAPGPQADADAVAPVRGTLLDQERHPVAEVSVTFVPQSGKGIYQAFSGEDGKFTLGSLPAGRYRVLVASPGHVALDLKSIEVPRAGLDLGLSLVDHPLNFKERRQDLLPREQPRPAPGATPGPPP